MIANQSLPRSTVMPELAYADIGQAMTWLCDAFGFTLRLRIADHRAQLNVGDRAVVLIEPAANLSERASVLVRVEDVNSHHERASLHCAQILRRPTTHMASGSTPRWASPGTNGPSPNQSPTSIPGMGRHARRTLNPQLAAV